MAIFVLCIRRHDDWAEIARFEATGPADALHKARLVVPPEYGNGPIKLIEQPAPEPRPLHPHPGQPN